MGLELDLTKIDPADMALFQEAVKRYKDSRHHWHTGTFHRILTVDENLLGAATISKDQCSARIVMMQIDRPRSVIPPNIAIPGLDPDKNYTVQLDTPVEVAKRASRRFDNPLVDGGFVMSGSVLGSAGIQLPVLYAQTGVAISLESA